MDQRNELLTELGVEDIGLVAEEVRAGNSLEPGLFETETNQQIILKSAKTF